MFELPLEHILALMNNEPGSGMAQTVLLALIWWNSRGLKKEIIALRGAVTHLEITHETRIAKLETTTNQHGDRLSVIETKL